MSIVFSLALADRVSSIQDPVTGGCMAFESFLDTYQPVLELLDGSDMSSYFDFFFEPSFSNPACWMFVDDDAMMDFRDEAMLMGLIPTIGEIMKGEDNSAEIARKRMEQSRKEQQRRSQQKVPTSAAEKARKKLLTAQSSAQSLQERIAKETDAAKRTTLQNKLDKIMTQLSAHGDSTV